MSRRIRSTLLMKTKEASRGVVKLFSSHFILEKINLVQYNTNPQKCEIAKKTKKTERSRSERAS